MPKIVFLSDFPDRETGEPLSSNARYLLEELTSKAGIEPEDYTVLTVFPKALQSRKIEEICSSKETSLVGWPAILTGKYVSGEYTAAIQATLRRIDLAEPNIVVPLGFVAFWLTNKSVKIKKARGGLTMCSRGKHKVIPTWSPMNIFSQYNLYPVVYMDMTKVKRHMDNKIFRRPSRKIWLEPSIADLREFKKTYIDPVSVIGCDIETKRGQITEVGFAVRPTLAIVIPFITAKQADGCYWRSLEEELEAWEIVREVLRIKKLVGQNFQYDMSYFWRSVGIPSFGFHGDTMLLHHALQPEMEKSLGFLGSLYTDEPPWKTMRTDAETLKRED